MKRHEMRAPTSGPRTKPLHVGSVVPFALMRDRTSEQKMGARLMSRGRWKRRLRANKSGLIRGWGPERFTVALVSNRLQPTGFPYRGYVPSLWLPTFALSNGLTACSLTGTNVLYVHTQCTGAVQLSTETLWFMTSPLWVCTLWPIMDEPAHPLSPIYRSTDTASIFTSA